MNAHRVRRATTALPPCPGCKQSCTGVYNKQHGCTRCGTLHPRPRAQVPVTNYLNPAAISEPEPVNTSSDLITATAEKWVQSL